MIRKPVVAGSFYPGESQALKNELEEYIRFADTKKKVIGLISPHAGYVYSAGCAGKGFGQVEVPGTVIILGVNHQGFGHSYAVDGHDRWFTPLGDVEIDDELRKKLVTDSKIFAVDNKASSMEHSLEVQVPFIQYINPDAKILPITISSHDADQLIAGGKEIARLIKDNPDTLIVASSDMSHYVDVETAKEKDQKAIDKILALDPEGLFNVVASERISMCGVCPTTMMLSAALELGAQKAEIIEYTNSGKVSGDYYQVVAYLSMMVY
ncbi:MAG: AmmeMemoRadiSam system protein B [Candidatus Aminicenantes bacterium]|nr:MAG: AmmeMemoRadiSam system protein B [Candidatus Aminicenantes bacterium]